MSNPKTERNPRGAGKPLSGKRRQLTLTGLSDEQAALFDAVPSKAAYIRSLIQVDLESRKSAQ